MAGFRMRAFGAAVALAFALAGCGKSQDAQSNAPGAPHLGPRQANPLGFSVAMPEGWGVNAQSLQAIDIVSPDGKDAAMIRVKTIDGADTEGWLAREFLKGERWARTWQATPAKSKKRGVSRIAYDITRSDGMALHASAIAIRSGRIATVMIAVAPVENFKADLPMLAATLQSFSFAVPGTGQRYGARPRSAPQVDYVVWHDPREDAFTVEVPKGWQAEGGTVRPDASGVRTQLVLTAPGNRQIVWYGDWNLPRIFIQAGSAIRGLGPQQPSGSYAMANYQDAPTFAAGYLQGRFGQVEITNATRLQQVEHYYQQVSMQTGKLNDHHSAALIEFHLADGRMGAAQIVTSVTPNGFDDGATWFVTENSGFVSAPEEMNLAAMVWAHGRKTNRVNPQWFAAEARAQGQAAADFQKSRDEISAIQAGIVEERWGSETRIAEQNGRLLSGTTELVDPQTGERFETQATGKYYFRDVTAAGEANAGGPADVARDIDFNPSPADFRRLLEIQSNGAAQ